MKPHGKLAYSKNTRVILVLLPPGMRKPVANGFHGIFKVLFLFERETQIYFDKHITKIKGKKGIKNTWNRVFEKGALQEEVRAKSLRQNKRKRKDGREEVVRR